MSHGGVEWPGKNSLSVYIYPSCLLALKSVCNGRAITNVMYIRMWIYVLILSMNFIVHEMCAECILHTCTGLLLALSC